MMYKKYNDPSGKEMIVLIESNLFIPADPANSDYQQYLAWVAEGNTAEKWSPNAS